MQTSPQRDGPAAGAEVAHRDGVPNADGSAPRAPESRLGAPPAPGRPPVPADAGLGDDRPDLGGVRFADEEARARLAGRLGWVRHPRESGWQRVKSNASRTVWRGVVEGQGVYVKHYHPRSRLRRLVRRWGPSDAKREMRYMEYLARHGVATPRALAAACRGGEEWLATEAVEPSQTADLWHAARLREGAAGAAAIRRATAALGALVGRMHAAGVIHRDLHCGNVLILDGPDGPQPVLMDLHRVRRRRRLSRRARARNLAQIFYDRHDFTTRCDRLRFLKAYLAAGGGGGTLRGWQLLVEHFAAGHTRRQHADRDRRAAGNNKYFRRVNLGRRWRGHVVLASKRRPAGSKAAQMEFTADAWLAALAEPEALLSSADVEVVKDSRSVRVVRRRLVVGGLAVDVYVKRFRRKYPWKVLVDCFRPSRAVRAFRAGHVLLTRRIATPLPLAALERRTGPFLRDSILLTETCEGAALGPFLQTSLAHPPPGAAAPPAGGPTARTGAGVSLAPPRQRAQEVLGQLGRMVQRLHDNNLAHRDLKASNILVQCSPGADPRVVLLDLDGLSRRRRLGLSRKFQGLMRLNVSLLNCPVVNHAGRLRMLMGYLRRPGCGRIDFKPYWRVLEAWSQKKIRRQIHSRRQRQKAVRRPAP